MANYIAVYDLEDMTPSPYSRFIEQAEKQGWSAFIWGETSKKWLRLPNTTLIGEFSDGASAKKAFDDARGAAEKLLGRKIKVEKHLIATYAATSYSSDEKVD
ncbi:hypothetical protein [Aminobacter aminovorans]|uniref:Uncharacterized protein n=1 Tax=Aminobacter aminovorans TaxID=83263 RepID=A0AAC8YS18_AMIAI|nr:hypothetical protein [Aminobacter aminovorans]AMS43417.1 hypothetical protein AA2016_4505 [Aminobacter aminovorans]MBB3705446.1 hypothetical protein [Aminobacter aminovorans]WMC98754.1 hypothetical protein RAR13_08695 [Aminobacter aminovorans]